MKPTRRSIVNGKMFILMSFITKLCCAASPTEHTSFGSLESCQLQKVNRTCLICKWNNTQRNAMDEIGKSNGKLPFLIACLYFELNFIWQPYIYQTSLIALFKCAAQKETNLVKEFFVFANSIGKFKNAFYVLDLWNARVSIKLNFIYIILQATKPN